MKMNVSRFGQITILIAFAVGLTNSPVAARAAEPMATETTSTEYKDKSSVESPDQRRRSRRAKRQRWIQGKQLEWWAGIRTQLFRDIDLTTEQDQKIEAIIEKHLARRERYRRLHDDLASARSDHASKREHAILDEVEALNPKLIPSFSIDAMRNVLGRSQRSTFDVNRATFLAKAQSKKQQKLNASIESPRIE